MLVAQELYQGALAKGPWKSSKYQYYWRQHTDLKIVHKVAAPEGSANADWGGDVCPAPLEDGTPTVRRDAPNINPPSSQEAIAKL